MNKPTLKTIIAIWGTFISFAISGQNVFINNPSFIAALKTSYPQCVVTDGSGDYLNTTQAALVTELHLNNKNITSLEGIKYFTSLQILDVANADYPNQVTATENKISTLPSPCSTPVELPTTVKEIWMLGNNVSTLPDLSCLSLTILSMKSNPLTVLPALPNTVTRINVNFCKLSSFPSAFPNSLESLSAYQCVSSSWSAPSLPSLSNLPNLKTLGVGGNRLTSIPSLTNETLLQQLHVQENFALTALPPLPSTLTELYIFSTGITCLPNKPTGIATSFTSVPMCTMLPVELTSFKINAHQSSIDLGWTTASEVNISGFSVEHSTDGKNFTPLSYKTPKGGTNTTAMYAYTHDTPSVGVNYYRLKIHENDGTFSYSKVISDVLYLENSFFVYPNPVYNELNIHMNDNLNAKADLEIMDFMGRVLIKKTIGNDSRIDCEDMLPGMYILRINQAGNLTDIKLVKK
jgi:Secretion system C-terminal sorting domain